MTSNPTDLHIERLQAGNIPHLNKLHRAIYGHRLPSDYFIKKYDTAFTGVKDMGYIAFNSSGMAVGFYGVIPCFLQDGDKTVLSAQSADTMTHPEYRNLGLFTRLANLTVDLCKANKILIIFGFPNQNSYPGFIHKLRWQQTDIMSCFIIPINTQWWKRLMRKLPFAGRLYPFYINWILKKYGVPQSGLPNSVLLNGFGGVKHDDYFLKYKTYSPTRVIGADNALVWLKINHRLTIGDICLATDDFDAVLNKVIGIARQAGINEVIFNTSPGTKLHHLFSGRYPSMPTFPVIFKDLGSGLKLNRLKFTMADIDIF